MKISYVVFFLLFTHIANCQLVETFSDGNFKYDPPWNGDTTYFKVNTGLTLQSQGPASSGSIQLSTEKPSFSCTQWEFWCKLDFEPSSTNYPKIYLESDNSNLKNPLNGYYLKLGGESGTTDKVELYRQDGATSVKLVTGEPGTMGRLTNKIRIKVIKDIWGNWSVFADTSGAFNYKLQGVINDSTHKNGNFLGILYTHTSTRRNQFYFDDLKITQGTIFPIAAEALSENRIRLFLSKEPETISSTTIYNYDLIEIGNPAKIVRSSQASLDLQFATSIIKGYHNLSIKNILGADGDLMSDTTFRFYFNPPLKYGSILITELYPDPTPSNGLPEEEFIELYNNSSDTINLKDFTLSDGTTSSTFPLLSFLPHSYIILTSTNAQSLYQTMGMTLALNPWPSLNNTGDHIKLSSSEGKVIFEVNYSDHWYNDEEKKEGGWSLEMKNFKDYCSMSNWSASEDSKGATPGATNSIYTLQNDTIAPQLLTYDILDSSEIALLFNEEIDTLVVPVIKFNGLPLENIRFENTTKIIVGITSENKNCHLEVENIKDCKGNLSDLIHLSFVLPDKEDISDVIINEILFNPKANGVDFVELYNRSSKVLNLKNWVLQSLKNSDTISCVLFTGTYLIQPHSYLAFTPSLQLLSRDYLVAQENMVEIERFPSYNDDYGVVCIRNKYNSLIDRFNYSEDFHLKMIEDREGISLERISFYAPTNDPNNWHSASAQSSYATPGYENSQHFDSPYMDQFVIEPKVFTPDQDGQKDFTTLKYSFDSPGYICNLAVFDLAGRKIMTLADNFLLGKEGFFEWDGMDLSGKPAPCGLYIFVLDAFNTNGESLAWKGTAIIAPSR